MDDKEILISEWKEVRETLRYFGNKRFAQLTVFLVAQGAAISAFLNPANPSFHRVFQTAGLLLAGLFLLMERSAVRYWKQFAARGQAIETQLPPLELMSKYRPKAQIFGATTATYTLYFATAIFWLVSFACWSAKPVASRPFRIIVAGDDRAEYPSASSYPFRSPRAEDKDGINQVITQEIVQAVLDEQATILLWTGDLTNVSEGDSETFERQLLAWRDIVKLLYDHGVTVLPVRGNHEVVWYDPRASTHKPQDIPEAKKVWDKVFSGRFALPANGPSGEENVSFYDVRESVLVVGVDHYTNQHSVNQTWLNRILEENKRPFIFVYGHEPAFAAGDHPNAETLAEYPSRRDEFWESLIKAGARVYFCGHDHFYDRMSIARAGPDPGPEMHQLTAGTAGAPLYKQGKYGSSSGWEVTGVHHAGAYGYIVAEIEGNNATMTFKGRTGAGKYEAMDSFRYLATAR